MEQVLFCIRLVSFAWSIKSEADKYKSWKAELLYAVACIPLVCCLVFAIANFDKLWL